MPELPGVVDLLSPVGMGGQGLVAIALTANQIAHPTPQIVANVTATYYLVDSPFTRYKSDGASLIPLIGTALDVATIIVLTNQIQAVSQAVVAQAVATVPPSRIGPVVDAGVTYPDLATYLAVLSVRIGASGGTPSAPVKSAAPTVAFPGGTGDVGEVPTYTWGTYTGTAVTSRDVQVLVNGIVVSTVIGIANGAALPVIPASAGTGARSYAVNEIAHWAGETAPVQSSSIVYTINAVGAPINTTAPLITPSGGTDLTTLTAARGVYTVGGLTVNNATLTFAQRWAADWTLTGALTAATSANLNATWGGATGSYSVTFSGGSIKIATLTNGSAAFSWTGAVTATSAVQVNLTTATSVTPGVNGVTHAVRYFEIATGAGGASTETQASNAVTVTSSSSGGGPGVVEAGHRWWVSVPATGPQSWATYQTYRALWQPSGGRASQDAQAFVASIPISGGVTLPAGSTSAQINAALLANSIVFLAQGNYTQTAVLNNAGTWLIGLGTGAIFDCSGMNTGLLIGARLFDDGKLVNMTFYRAPNFGVWHNGLRTRMYKVSVQQAGVNSTNNGAVGMYYQGGSDCIAVSSESMNTIMGGDSDDWDVARGGESNNTFVDCHAYQGDDDGFDTWTSGGSHFFHYCTSIGHGLNTLAGSVSGDGNGFKLGGPVNSTPVHYLNQCTSIGNKAYGYNYNGTLPGNRHTLYACTGASNGKGLYAFQPSGFDPQQYIVIGAASPPPSGIVLDASTPARVTTTGSTNTESGTTAAFSPPANSWLYCSFSGNPAAAGSTPTWNVPTNTGTPLTWTKINEINNAAGGGIVVWRAFNAALQTGITVTCSDSWSGGTIGYGFAGMWVDVWAGANASQGTAAVGPATKTFTTQTFNLGVTTTAVNSTVVLVGADWFATGQPTSADALDAYSIANNMSGGRAYKTAPSVGAATVNMVMGASTTGSSFVAYEILA